MFVEVVVGSVFSSLLNVFCMHIFSFSSARKRPTCEKWYTLRSKIDVPWCALAPVPPARQRNHTIIIRKQLPNMNKNHNCFLLFQCRQALPRQRSQNDLPQPLRDPPGDALETPGAAQERPGATQSDPGGSQERPRSVPGATFPATSAPEAAQRPPGSHFGAILESFWFNVHSFLLSFSPPPATHFPTSAVTCFPPVRCLCLLVFQGAPRKSNANAD